jgi:hypothetical protein
MQGDVEIGVPVMVWYPNQSVVAVMRSVNRKRCCAAFQWHEGYELQQQVLVLHSPEWSDIGIKTWGHIDFLRRQGFQVREFWHQADYDAIKDKLRKKV